MKKEYIAPQSTIIPTSFDSCLCAGSDWKVGDDEVDDMGSKGNDALSEEDDDMQEHISGNNVTYSE